MKILYIQKQDFDDTTRKIMDIHKKGNEVTIIDVRQIKNYDQIVDAIVSCDRVISW